MISIHIEVPERYRNKAEYVFAFFSLAWGLPIRRSSAGSSDAHIIYSSDPSKHRDKRDSVIIGFEESLYMAETVCKLTPLNDSKVWTASGNASNVDFVGSSFRLLTMLDESQVDPQLRDDKDTFIVDALPDGRREGAHLPLADVNAKVVLDKLLALYPHMRTEVEPRWPGRALYVIASTHDTDVVSLGAPTELAKHLIKLVLTRDRTYLEMFFKGLKYLRNPTGNPAFGFPLWREYESLAGMRSCFYIYCRIPGTRFHLRDCKSDVFSAGIDWSLLRRMAKDGWEFGLHPPINAKLRGESFVIGKQRLEEKLGVQIRGLRHHWWALDWLKPHRTLLKHELAGYEYDASLAWRGAPGFRAGTSLPFLPFDVDRDAALGIYELPTCLMDGHIMNHRTPVDLAVDNGTRIIDIVRKIGGMCMVDWHTETICDSMLWRNLFTVLKVLVDKSRSRGDVWIATPSQIVDHWRTRAARLLETYDRRRLGAS